MKKYMALFRIKFNNGLQYRAAAAAGVSTQFAWGGMLILMYKAFYDSDPSGFPMEFHQLSSYIWLQQAFLALFGSWFWENDIFNSIESGDVAYELIRPVDVYNMWFVKNAANRLSKAILRCLPILIFAVFLPYPYGISLPSSPGAFFAFVLTMAFALISIVAFSMFIYIMSFHTISSMGPKTLCAVTVDVLAGQYIPLNFFPGKLRYILELTPFATMQNVPLRIYSGNISGNEMIFSIFLQIFWIIVMLFAGQLLMKRSLKRVVVQGG